MMKRLLARAGIVVAVAAMLLSGLVAPANAWGDKSKCLAHDIDGLRAYGQGTNRYDTFLGHHMDVYGKACWNRRKQRLVWVRRPVVTFPSRFNPFTVIEDLAVTTKPFVIWTSADHWKVRYKFVVKQTVAKVPAPVTFAFVVTFTPLGNRICHVAGSGLRRLVLLEGAMTMRELSGHPFWRYLGMTLLAVAFMVAVWGLALILITP